MHWQEFRFVLSTRLDVAKGNGITQLLQFDPGLCIATLTYSTVLYRSGYRYGNAKEAKAWNKIGDDIY